MDKFIVSARKYRPQNFNTVVGQSHITTTLKNAIKNNQLAHAFLFCGPRGVGKTTCARILAKTINCTNLTPEGEACNACPSCLSFDAGTSLNIHELDAASNNSVDDIRALVEQVRFAPQAGKYKVYIVDEVHMLSASAFNAFLKTLEEPPPYAIFILATTEKHKILPTILSRCQIFDFKRISTNDTVEHLEEIVGKEHIQADKASLQVIAQKSEGCMRDALSILDKIVSFTNGEVTYQNTLEHLNILDEDYYFKLLECLLQQDLAEAMLLFDEINRKGFEGDLVLNGFAEFIRNILVCKDEKAASLLDVVEGMQTKYTEAAKKTDAGFLVSALNILNEAEINYKMARNKRLHVELALIKLNFLQQAIELSFSNNTVVKKKRIDGAIALKTSPIMPLQVKTKPVEAAKLMIEEEKTKVRSQKLEEEKQTTINRQPTTEDRIQNTEVGSQKSEEEKSGIRNPKPGDKNSKSKPTESKTPTSSGTKKTLLDVLREKAGDRYSIEEIKEAESLTIEKLQQCWNDYATQLEEQQKHSSAGTFRIAKLNIENDIMFSVTVDSLTSQKFVEQEKLQLIDFVQQQFNNRSLRFSIKVEEGEQPEIPQHLVLNSRQRFERIAEQYPLIKELKDKLRLEIDF